jgi:type IV secretion system protein VirB7
VQFDHLEDFGDGMKTPTALLALALATSVSGCASLTGASAPSCDGSARRPLNRSLWDWDSARPIAVTPIEAPAPAPAPSPNVSEPIIRKGEVGDSKTEARAATLPAFDIAASTRSCEGADHG